MPNEPAAAPSSHAEGTRPRHGMPPRPSARQAAILDFIAAYIAARGYPPTYREIGDACHLASISAVHYQLERLQQQGLIACRPRGAARSLRLTRAPEA